MTTAERLAKALQDAGAPDLAERAKAGEFSDFQPLHATPKMLLVSLLRERGLLRHRQANDLAQRIIMGEFDDTKAEGEEWWHREGRRLLGGLGGDRSI